MRSENFFFLQILVLAFAFSACQKNVAENTTVSLANNSASLDSELQIEKVDFKNFTYPYPKSETTAERNFTLANGEKPYGKVEDISFSLRKIDYADLTVDGKNEAIINLSVGLAVSSTNYIYIYTLEDKPILLWAFGTGEKALGGLKSVYVKDGELIVELFGNNKFKGEELDLSSLKGNTDSRPKVFTKMRFRWNGAKFALEGKSEVFDYNWKKETNKQ